MVLRAARSTRIIAAVLLAPLDLVLLVGGVLADGSPDGRSILLGAILLLGALRIFTTRTVCDRSGVGYSNLIRRRIPAAAIAAVRVTMTGYQRPECVAPQRGDTPAQWERGGHTHGRGACLVATHAVATPRLPPGQTTAAAFS